MNPIQKAFSIVSAGVSSVFDKTDPDLKGISNVKFIEKENLNYVFTPDGKKALFFYKNENKEFFLLNIEQYGEKTITKYMSKEDYNLESLYKMLTGESKTDKKFAWEIIKNQSK